jgi:hypothetical protein
MTVSQKHAWYNLAVIGTTAALILALIPALGPGALGGFGLLGLLGITPWLFRPRGQVTSDERDVLIQRRSILVGYSVFWLVFVLVCMSLPVVYGWRGSVPVPVVQSSVFVAMMLVIGVSSAATLVQYGREGTDAA